jgi:transposase
MIALNRRTRIFICREPTDMRSSYDSLVERSKSVIKRDPLSGHLFVFVNQHRTSMKALYYDGTGLVIVAKRLEKSRFSMINPRFPGAVVLTQAEFNLFFEGANLEKRFIDSPVELKRKSKLKNSLIQKTHQNGFNSQVSIAN